MLTTSLGKNAALHNIDLNDDDMITSLYGLLNPDPEELKKRDEKIAELINSMGFKYRLSRPMPRIK
jgi:hypothetical protein